MQWLPEVLPAGVVVIVSGSREDPAISSLLSRSDATELSMRVEWGSREQQRLQLMAVLNQMLSRFHKVLDQEHLLMIADWACDHTPETLMMLVDEIRQCCLWCREYSLDHEQAFRFNARRQAN